MRVNSANGIFSSSLYKAYFGNEGSSVNSTSGVKVSTDAIVSQLSDVKSNLYALALKARQLTERQRASISDTSTPSLPSTFITPGNIQVSISTENANRPTKFEKQISKALAKAFKNGDKKLLSSSKVSGDVKVTLKDGENSEAFSIHVNKDTTVQGFVNEFNSKANGKAEAELKETIVNGRAKFRVNLVGAPGAQVIDEPDDVEFSDDIASEGDAAKFEEDIKGFVSDVNKLVSKVLGNKAGITSIQSEVGLVDSLRELVTTLKSKDGSTSLSTFISENSKGVFVVNGAAAREAFLNNSEGVVDLLDNLSAEISGTNGLKQIYGGYGGNLDKISNVVKIIGQAQTKYSSDGLLADDQIRAQREQNIQNLVTYAGKIVSQKA